MFDRSGFALVYDRARSALDEEARERDGEPGGSIFI
jgi:hypothetical protein